MVVIKRTPSNKIDFDIVENTTIVGLSRMTVTTLSTGNSHINILHALDMKCFASGCFCDSSSGSQKRVEIDISSFLYKIMCTSTKK